MTGSESMLLEQLARRYRHNSSTPKAIAGKLARLALDASNSIRVWSYNASVESISMPATGRDPRLFAVCFTCAKHFDFIKIALLSLNETAPQTAQVFVFSDCGNRLSMMQQRGLAEASCIPLSFHDTTYPMRAWGGPKVIVSETMAFRMIAKRMSASDVLMKFDSDVVFIGDAAILEMLTGKAEAMAANASVAHRTQSEEQSHMQGGCYFLRGSALAKILSRPLPPRIHDRTEWGNIGEDRFFSEMLGGEGIDIEYRDFMYIDPQLVHGALDDAGLHQLLSKMPAGIDLVHFEGTQGNRSADRSNMWPVYRHYFGRGTAQQSYVSS